MSILQNTAVITWSKRTYLWHLDLVTLLEVLRESLDELYGWDVLDGDSHLSVDNTFYLL